MTFNSILRRFLPRIIRSPAFDEAQTENTQASEIVNAQIGRGAHRLRMERLLHSSPNGDLHVLIHLRETLVQVEDLDTSLRIDLVHRIARGSTRFSVEIERLKEHRLVAAASDPDIAFVSTLKTNAFANVESRKQS